MPVRVVQHPLVEDVLARLRDKTTPSEEFPQLSPTGWRCSSWLKPPATCPCRTSRPDGGHGRVGGHGDRARRRPGGPPALDRGGARRGLHGGPGPVPERPPVHPGRPRRPPPPAVRHVARTVGLNTLLP